MVREDADKTRLDDMGFGTLKIFQRPGAFCYGLDAVLLADMAARHGDVCEAAADLGAGNGAVSLILSHKTRVSKITAFELQKDAAEMAGESISYNGLADRIEVVCGDILDIPESFSGRFDTVVSNPPYFRGGCGLENSADMKKAARHETTASLEDFLHTAARLLCVRGEMFLIHRPERLADIFAFAERERLEPKLMRPVVPFADRSPSMMLFKFVKNGGRQLTVLPQLCVRNKDGSYTDEISEIYERKNTLQADITGNI